MDLLLRGWWRMLRVLGAIELVAGKALILLIVGAISVQVFTRYFFNRPIAWVEDVATFAFIWATFIGAAAALKQGRHIQIETFHARLRPVARALTKAAIFAVILVACVMVARWALPVMTLEARSRTIALPVNLPRHWFYSVPLFYGLVSMAATAAYFVLAHLAEAFGRQVDAERDNAARAEEERRRDEEDAHVIEQGLIGKGRIGNGVSGK